jgi:hypothetical protein
VNRKKHFQSNIQKKGMQIAFVIRQCLNKDVIEGKVEGTRRGSRRRNQLLDDLKKKDTGI